MDYKKLIGFGIIIWVAAFILASTFIVLGQDGSLFMKLIIPFSIGFISYILAGKLKTSDLKKVLQYAIVWIIIGLILDGIITVPFTGPEIFLEWNVWLGYSLVLVGAIFAAKNKKEPN